MAGALAEGAPPTPGSSEDADEVMDEALSAKLAAAQQVPRPAPLPTFMSSINYVLKGEWGWPTISSVVSSSSQKYQPHRR